MKYKFNIFWLLALQSGLKTNFQEVKVEVTDCPDLTKAPFHLAGSGLSGNSTIIEYGGVPYLLPLVDLTKLYDLNPMLTKIADGYGQKGFFVIGAGAGPHTLHNQNCEVKISKMYYFCDQLIKYFQGMLNLKVNADGSVINQTHIAKTKPDGSFELLTVPATESKSALLGNLFMSEGKPGKVLKVVCKKRIGNKDFITAMRLILASHFPEHQTVGLGGVFLLKSGKVKQHVMDSFSKTPITNETELNSWLKFYEMSAPLIALGTFMNRDIIELDLRVQHFHSFSKEGNGGHYHYDTTPEEVEYEGYFQIGEKLVRIDKPSITHQFGRD